MKIQLPLTIPQAGALPFRIDSKGKIQILLITSRKGGKWIIPKGMMWFSTDSGRTAKKEAYEEAGVEGEVSPAPTGVYTYQKSSVTYQVNVHTMKVTREYGDWPERGFRQRKWVRLKAARKLIKQKALKKLIKESVSRL